MLFQSFYPTYEALKPFRVVNTGDGLKCFYPTYEALKLQIGIYSLPTSLMFLPYLWGIETLQRRSLSIEQFLFLPYLWGIET